MPPRGQQRRWATVLAAALSLWDEASRDSRVSEEFRRVCGMNRDALQRWSANWADTT
jgi:hypothetical protein